jgi:hypothetical protein
MASDHLSPEDLARLAVTGEEDPHVAGCEVCAGELGSFHGVVERLRPLPEPPERLIEAAAAYFGRRRRLEALVERLAEDPALQARARRDPAAVLRDAGLEPLPELLDALSDTGRDPGDLARRIAAKRLWS